MGAPWHRHGWYHLLVASTAKYTGSGTGGGACLLADTPDDRKEDRSTDVFYEGNGLPVEDRAWDSGCGPLPDLSGRGLQAF